jgi:hypothetical protein
VTKSAIGTHFPDVADLIAADLSAARLTVRFKPAASAASLGRSVRVDRRGSAGLGSDSTRTSTATKPGCSVTQLNWQCDDWENEPGINEITTPGLGAGNA